MQLCWKLGLTWKSKLPDDILLKWQPWVEQIPELTGYAFKRTIMRGLNPERLHHQLYVFADASQDTYAAVAYMRGEGQGNITVRIIQARSRIMPIKATHTIPRMELLGIELGPTLLKKLAKTYRPHDTFICTDSRACYDWMRIETRSLQIFIKNRVLKVRQYLMLDQIRWVPGALNPADAATQGFTVKQLRDHKVWLKRPEFLYQSQAMWPTQPEASNADVYSLRRCKGGQKGRKNYKRTCEHTSASASN
jgi:hypothetical protein